MQKLIILFLTNILLISAQTKDPEAILEGVKKNFNKIKDYQVDVKVKLDVDFIKMPDTDAKIYFKQPDKVHLESAQFAIVPKEGLDFSPLGFIKGEYTAVYVKEEQYKGHNTSVVKIIPLQNENDVILTTLWVDASKSVIRKVESNTRVSGNIIIEFSYPEKVEYPLPSQMVFSFNTDKLNTIRGMSTPRDEMKAQTRNQNQKKGTTGKVMITYSNYIVNNGIPDSVFEEKKQK